MFVAAMRHKPNLKANITLTVMTLNRLSTGQKIALWTIALVIIDQVVKLMINAYMVPGDRISVFPWFELCYVENPGFAFGMEISDSSGGADWGKIVLSLFRMVMIGAIIYGIRYLLKRRPDTPKGVLVGAVLILAGAIGNMVDSMFYGMFIDYQDGGFLTGKVIDMIHLPLFRWDNPPAFLDFLVGSDGYFFGAVFNIADAYISVAVVYLVIFQYKFFK